jgi:hypothetical protein
MIEDLRQEMAEEDRVGIVDTVARVNKRWQEEAFVKYRDDNWLFPADLKVGEWE